MERDKLKLIVRNLKLLVEALESEVFSDVDAYKTEETSANYITDYDEVFDDDDDYDDSVTNRINNLYRLVNDDDGDGL
jgi:hypothetical protein